MDKHIEVSGIAFDLTAVAKMGSLEELENTEAAGHLGADAAEVYKDVWHKAQHFKPKPAHVPAPAKPDKQLKAE